MAAEKDYERRRGYISRKAGQDHEQRHKKRGCITIDTASSYNNAGSYFTTSALSIIKLRLARCARVCSLGETAVASKAFTFFSVL